MTQQEKESLIQDVLHDAKCGGNLEAMFTKYDVNDPYLQADIRSRWSVMEKDEKVKAAQEREANRAACGYAGNPNDQALIAEANKEIANLIDEGTKELLSH